MFFATYLFIQYMYELLTDDFDHTNDNVVVEMLVYGLHLEVFIFTPSFTLPTPQIYTRHSPGTRSLITDGQWKR